MALTEKVPKKQIRSMMFQLNKISLTNFKHPKRPQLLVNPSHDVLNIVVSSDALDASLTALPCTRSNIASPSLELFFFSILPFPATFHLPFFVRIKETFTAGHMPHDFTTEPDLAPLLLSCECKTHLLQGKTRTSPNAPRVVSTSRRFQCTLCAFLNGSSSCLFLILHYGELRVLMLGKT